MDGEEFARLMDPYRRELLAHCYRLTGSLHDAEDAVQETYLRAWRSYEGFEGRSSLRHWLHRIATNACLRSLEQTGRRPLPSGLGEPSEETVTTTRLDIPWLEPIPDVLLGTRPDDPAEVVASRGSVRLAFVAALQLLPARQRAVLILRDVLAWRAAEVADLLGTSTAAVNSALLRARAQLADVAPAEDQVSEPAASDERAQLDQYVKAFETADLATLERLLCEDVVLEMPPIVTWFAGRDMVSRFFGTKVLTRSDVFRMIPTSANGQPAFAAYMRGDDGVFNALDLHVLTVTPGGIARIVVFHEPRLFAAFGLPPVLDEDASARP